MRSVAVIGGGPSALFLLKRLVELGPHELRVEIFEKKDALGQGMPYGPEGSGPEHITNVSSSELPHLGLPLDEWVRALPEQTLRNFGIQRSSFSQDKVLPRRLFGQYLESRFRSMLLRAERQGLRVDVHLRATVTDLVDEPEGLRVIVEGWTEPRMFDRVVVCTGHHWPRPREGRTPGYYDSPYPPAKLARRFNHPVALRGSSLTALDAIRTLARANGKFVRESPHRLTFEPDPESPRFSLVMHSRSGLLPCVRFHLEDPLVGTEGLLQEEDYHRIREAHDGFVPLDIVFEDSFKQVLKGKDPDLYQRVKSLTIEEFVEAAMKPREGREPFDLFRLEYAEALQSLREEESVHWKEALAVLSFAVNFPAKYFSAEDMLRLTDVLLPLISIVIAFLPHSSVQEMLALHEAGRLSLVSVGSDSKVEARGEGGVLYHHTNESGVSRATRYQTYIDCVGQPRLPLEAFPFRSLLDKGLLRQARVPFRCAEQGKAHSDKDEKTVERDADGTYHLLVPGVAINDQFQPLGPEGQVYSRLHIMAVPYIGGHNPDYSGVDFCEEASRRIVEDVVSGSAPRNTGSQGDARALDAV